MKNSNAKIIKALEELGLRERPSSVSPEIKELEQRLKDYEAELGPNLDPEKLHKYIR